MQILADITQLTYFYVHGIIIQKGGYGKFMNIILLFAGIAILFNGVMLSMLSNFNLGVLATVFAGIFFTAWGIFYRKINDMTKRGFPLAVKWLIIAAVCIEVLFVGFIFAYGMNDTAEYNEDVVIVLGAGVRGDRVTLPLKLRLDRAAEYHRKNPDALIIVSGGQGLQETVTEASAMEKYLLTQGVDASKIMKEEKATSTNENMRFSKEIADSVLGGEYKTAIITNNFHIYRSTRIAKHEGLGTVRHMHAGLQYYNILPCGIRESLAIIKMWVFD